LFASSVDDRTKSDFFNSLLERKLSSDNGAALQDGAQAVNQLRKPIRLLNE
jgi:hypothetical protein